MKFLGGKVVDFGSYGCVFRPAIRCKNESRRRDGIAKLMSSDNGYQELEEYKIMRDIDREKRYYLGVPHLCTPGRLDDEDKRDWECKIAQRPTSDYEWDKTKRDLKLLVQKDGGTSFSDFLRVGESEYIVGNFDKIMKQIAKLAEGITKMKAGNVMHFDVKQSNIVIHPESFAMYFIDFGLLQYISPHDESHRYLDPYFAYPFELLLCHSEIFSLNDQELGTRVRSILSSKRAQYREKLMGKIHGKRTNPHEVVSYLTELRKKYPSLSKLRRLILPTVDTFSYGIAIGECAAMFAKYGEKKKQSSLTTFMRSLLQVCQGMCAIDVTKRTSIEKSHEYLTNLSLILRKGRKDYEENKKNVNVKHGVHQQNVPLPHGTHINKKSLHTALDKLKRSSARSKAVQNYISSFGNSRRSTTRKTRRHTRKTRKTYNTQTRRTRRKYVPPVDEQRNQFYQHRRVWNMKSGNYNKFPHSLEKYLLQGNAHHKCKRDHMRNPESKKCFNMFNRYGNAIMYRLFLQK